jgi:capsid protein
MSLRGRLVSILTTQPGQWWANRKPASDPKAKVGGDLAVRRWDGAFTDRLNTATWDKVTGNSINADAEMYLSTLRNRCIHAASVNPDIRDVIHTHATDCVGGRGPVLQVDTNNTEYAKAYEAAWNQWWAMPDRCGQLAGPDMVKLWFKQLWPIGAFLIHLWEGYEPRADDDESPIKLRLQNISPLRLSTPLGLSALPAVEGTSETILGITYDENGRPSVYHIQVGADPNSVQMGWKKLPAKDVIHGFERDEAGQGVGIPLLAAVLQDAADMREYDKQVLDAARSAADTGVVFHTNHPDAPYIEVDAAVDIERRQMVNAPPGWDPFQLKPEQPSTGYVEYRRERKRAIGGPVGMPLMIIEHNSSDHNYAAARFDDQGYRAGNTAKQCWIERVALERIRKRFEKQATLARLIPSKAPDDVTFRWNWPVKRHVDALKETLAEIKAAGGGWMTFSGLCRAHNLDPEAVVKEHVRDRKMFEDAGLPSPTIYEFLEQKVSGKGRPQGAVTEDENAKPTDKD